MEVEKSSHPMKEPHNNKIDETILLERALHDISLEKYYTLLTENYRITLPIELTYIYHPHIINIRSHMKMSEAERFGKSVYKMQIALTESAPRRPEDILKYKDFSDLSLRGTLDQINFPCIDSNLTTYSKIDEEFYAIRIIDELMAKPILGVRFMKSKVSSVGDITTFVFNRLHKSKLHHIANVNKLYCDIYVVPTRPRFLDAASIISTQAATSNESMSLSSISSIPSCKESALKDLNLLATCAERIDQLEQTVANHSNHKPFSSETSAKEKIRKIHFEEPILNKESKQKHHVRFSDDCDHSCQCDGKIMKQDESNTTISWNGHTGKLQLGDNGTLIYNYWRGGPAKQIEIWTTVKDYLFSLYNDDTSQVAQAALNIFHAFEVAWNETEAEAAETKETKAVHISSDNRNDCAVPFVGTKKLGPLSNDDDIAWFDSMYCYN